MAPHRFRHKAIYETSPLLHQTGKVYATIPLYKNEQRPEGPIRTLDTTQTAWQRLHKSPRARSILLALQLAAWTAYTIYLWYRAAQTYPAYDASFHWFLAASLHICLLSSFLTYLALSPRGSDFKSHRVRCFLVLATPSVMYVYMVRQAICQYLEAGRIGAEEEEDGVEATWAGMGALHLVLALLCCGLGVAGVILSEPMEGEEVDEDDCYDEEYGPQTAETVGWRHW